MKEFDRGVFIAAAYLNNLYSNPKMAAGIIMETGLEDSDVSELAEFEREELEIVNKEHGMHLTGLGGTK